jgi:hypothetical protein
MASQFITLTPISGDIKKRSNIDFNEQKERTKNLLDGDQFWTWDDSRHNTSKPGDLFAFFFPQSKLQTGKVIIHRIIAVKNPSERLPSWSKNVGQDTRNVVELSPPKIEFSMTEWQEMGGKMSKNCTYRTSKGFETNSILQRITRHY